MTVKGASAGAASIMHQITAYAGQKGDAPFQQAFPQSPGFDPSVSNYQHEEVFAAFLSHANATSLAELRAAPASALITANLGDNLQQLVRHDRPRPRHRWHLRA